MKTPLKTKSMFLIIILPFIVSCMSGYIPNAASTSFYEKPGDGNVSIYSGTNGIDGQASIAVNDKVFLMTSASYLSQDSSKVKERDYSNHKYFEAGLGYYLVPNYKWRISFMGGAGLGKVKFIQNDYYDDYYYYDYQSNEIYGDYMKFFIQNNIGFTTKIVDFGFNLRYNFVHFSDYYEYGTDFGAVSGQFLEPSIFVRLGYKNIRYQLQYSLVYNITRDCDFDYDPIRISFGLSLNFNAFGKKSDDK